MRLIRKGEYDLVNISLLGFDPLTGKSFEECHAEWKAELTETEELIRKTRWYNVVGHVQNRWRVYKLMMKSGF